MWLQVVSLNKDGSLTGILQNDPVVFEGLIKDKDVFKFLPEHIIGIE